MSELSIPSPKLPEVFRVIHTADWHLGKTMGDLDRIDEHRRFLAFLCETIRSINADALVIAGDVFDSATPPQSAIRLYFDFLAELNARGGRRCGVVVTAGNHDSPAHLEAPRELLQAINVQVVASLPMGEGNPPEFAPELTLVALPSPDPDAVRLVIAAVPFLRERDLRTGQFGQSSDEIQRDLRNGVKARYAAVASAAEPWQKRGVPVLATGHLTALGGKTSESERDIHVGGLGAVGADAFPELFAYVALGHLHRPQEVGGKAHIRYSGSPIALSFSEATDLKEIRVLDFVGDRLVANEGIPVPQARKLVQLRVAETELELQLAAFLPPECDLTPWVEVVITNATGVSDLYKTVQDAVAGKAFRVVRVMVERAGRDGALTLATDAAEDDEGALLADPDGVFRRRLELESMEETDREVLIAAFTELRGMLEDRQRVVP